MSEAEAPEPPGSRSKASERLRRVRITDPPVTHHHHILSSSPCLKLMAAVGLSHHKTEAKTLYPAALCCVGLCVTANTTVEPRKGGRLRPTQPLCQALGQPPGSGTANRRVNSRSEAANLRRAHVQDWPLTCIWEFGTQSTP